MSVSHVYFCQSLKMLDDEETTDNELRSKFNQRWNRTPSGDLYKPLRAGIHPPLVLPRWSSFICHLVLLILPPTLFRLPEGGNFRNILDKAVQADQVVRDRYNAQCDMIALLCKPENELNAAIPSANPTRTLQGSEVCPSPLRFKRPFLLFLLVFKNCQAVSVRTQRTQCAWCPFPTHFSYLLLTWH